MASSPNTGPQPSRLTRRLTLSGILLLWALLAVSHAQITLDGSLGPGGPLPGPNYRIGAELGQLRGGNLFHSFGEFNVPIGNSATFTGPNTIANIVGRITGGQPSTIDGQLRSEIAGANLYLLNPSGVLFGPHASLDVRGSFHVSTADFLRFADGATFSAHLGQESVLTVAAPAAFGFLSGHPAAITIQGSTLEVPDRKALSVVGGEVHMRGGVLRARSGRMQLASVASPGDVRFSPLELAPDLLLDGFARLGRLALSQEATVTVSNLIEGSDVGAGTVLLRGGRLLVDNASIQANTATGESARLGIDLRLAEDVVLTHGAQLRAGSTGAGRAGDVQLMTGGLHMDNSLIVSPPSGSGHGGNITVHVDRFTLTGGAQISSSSFGAGRGGHVTVAAGEVISIAGRNSVGFKSGLFSTAEGRGDAGRMAISAPTLTMDEGLITTVTEGAGRGGDLEVKVGRLTLMGGAFIDSSTNGTGPGGTVTLTATDAVTISGRDSAGVPSGLLSFARGRGDMGRVTILAPALSMLDGGTILTGTTTAGRAGDVEVQVGRLTLTGGADISSHTFGDGQGGMVTLTATDAVTISGQGHDGLPSNLSSTAAGHGDAGRVAVVTPTLSLDGGRIATATTGEGRAGDIAVEVGQLTLTGGAFIDSSNLPDAEGGGGTGQGGTVTVTATDAVTISGRRGAIRSGLSSTAAGRGDAGRVAIFTPTLSLDGGGISTTSTGGEGRAGDIVVEVGRLTLTGGAVIDSSTNGTEPGGTVTVTATDSIAISGRGRDGLRSTLSSFTLGRGDAGRLTISAPALSMDEGLIETGTGGEGRAGDIVVEVGRLTLTGGAVIDSSTFVSGQGGTVTVTASDVVSLSGRNSGLFTRTAGSGPGGAIDLRAQQVQLRDGGTISASSTGAGDAGTIRLQVGESFRSQNGAVTTATEGAGGGAIALTAGRLVQLQESDVTTSVRGGGGDAGNLTLGAPFIVADGSHIIANAFGGRGGNIRIGAEVFLADPASLVSASSELGISGIVDIQAPVTSLGGTLAALPQAFVNVAALLPARCAARWSGGKASSLVLGGRDGLPADPSDVLPSPLVLEARLAADPAVAEAPPRQPPSARFALLAGQEKALPRLRGAYRDLGCTP